MEELYYRIHGINSNLSTVVADEDIKQAVKDEYGVFYSKDGLRLLGCGFQRCMNYTIKHGTKVICNYAFDLLSSLQHLTFSDSI